MPSGKRDVPTVEDNHDGTVSLKYGPKEQGLHELFVKYNGENVQGKSGFQLGGFDAGSVMSDAKRPNTFVVLRVATGIIRPGLKRVPMRCRI